MRTRDIPKFARAQTLRAASTEAERKLWHRLRDRRLGGTKFVRQAPVGPYYADFVCRACKLVVELDGSQHVDSAHDDKRDAILIALGYRVLRFWNADVLSTIDDVCETIVAALEGRLEPFERFKQLTTEVGAAPHPSRLRRDTFSPLEARRRE
jgi:very-short-patch-repair endonuclease